MIHRFRFIDTLAKLDTALAYCAQIKVDVSDSRFVAHQQLIRALVPAIEKHELPEAHDQEKAIWALIEALELTETVMPFVRTLPLATQQYKLRRIMQGPVLARLEEAEHGTNDPRNTQFEVTLAAKLSDAGLSPDFAEPDISCAVPSGRMLIACKRPFRPVTIGNNAERARKQLLRAIAERGDARGAIAISLTRSAIPLGGVLPVRSAAEIAPALERVIVNHIRDRHSWSPSLDPTLIAGWIFHVGAIVEVQDEDLFVLAEQMLNVVVAPTGTPAHRMFTELGGRLSQRPA